METSELPARVRGEVRRILDVEAGGYSPKGYTEMRPAPLPVELTVARSMVARIRARRALTLRSSQSSTSMLRAELVSLE